MRPLFPFTSIVGQEEMKLALVLNAIDPSIGGVLIMGHRGTGKSTAVRALAGLLPDATHVKDCPYRCDPQASGACCAECARRRELGKRLPVQRSRPRVVELPLGATEDRVCGSLNVEKALREGKTVFQPGLLASANRGFLYIDEVNLLEDHIVDLLLDVAASGWNVVEREGLSVRHPARFVLVGSGNPEEGELRPQLLDRFGLSADVRTPDDVATRIMIVRRRDAFDRDPARFAAEWEDAGRQQREQIVAARERLQDIAVPDAVLADAAQLCIRLGTDGLRGELTLMRAARALAALSGVPEVERAHLLQIAPSALRHRLRRDPLDDAVSTTRVTR